MSQFAAFMKSNKKERTVVEYVATKSIVDENGNPMKWKFRPITSAEFEQLKDDCTKQSIGKNGASAKVDMNMLTSEMIVSCTVYPDLYDAELMKSYDVTNARALLYELVDNAGEYADLAAFVQKICGFKGFDEEIEEAKN
ncbi:MAG: hypothetical protein Q4C42_05235 [Clostridia bacterium]|nr:hypothetical protein [Clostridia bacterium]